MLNTFEETFEVTEMRTFKHEPFVLLGAEGGGLFVVLYGNKIITLQARGGGGAKKKVIDTIPKILKIKVQVNPPPPPPPTNTPILDHAP